MYIVVSRARSRNAFTRSSVCLSKLPNAKMCSSERRHRERLMRETERERLSERERCDVLKTSVVVRNEWCV